MHIYLYDVSVSTSASQQQKESSLELQQKLNGFYTDRFQLHVDSVNNPIE